MPDYKMNFEYTDETRNSISIRFKLKPDRSIKRSKWLVNGSSGLNSDLARARCRISRNNCERLMTCLEKKWTDSTSERSEARGIGERGEEGDKNAEETGKEVARDMPLE
jgi:hypothetical protein